MLDYGFYAFEKVFTVQEWRPLNSSRGRSRQMVTWSKFAPRHPMTVEEFVYDSSGDWTALNHRRVDGSTGQYTSVPIPKKKLILFTLDKEGEDPTGLSVLRSAYKHWYYKENFYKIDAIQKERHGIGIPVVKLPMGFSNDDKRLANEMGENLRTNEKAHVTLPPGWALEMLAMNTNLVDALKSAEHHDLMIARNVLGQFMNLGSTTSGSRALGGQQQEIFIKSLSYVADLVRGELNQNVIPELVRFNWANVQRYPELKVRRIGETQDLRAFSAAIRNLGDSGFLTPDPELERWLRDQMDFPIPPPEVMDRSVEDRVAPKKGNTVKDPTQPEGAEQASRQGNRGADITLIPKEA